ncbi:MAG: hypothetical protein GY870_08825 [archaeon]|nr:hypothetical protein [archaeon]
MNALPEKKKAENTKGEAFSIAYPIQGLLKYHGMSNIEHRTAFFPSLSLNNDSVYTITYLKFDDKFEIDRFILNGVELSDIKYDRIKHQLDFIRDYSSYGNKALVISRNIRRKDSKVATGKGLGTSASGGAAIARAAFSILYNSKKYIDNATLLSVSSRYLAGSATRSSTGGISIWMNYPGIDPKDSFSIRLDKESDKKFIQNIDLITISIPLNIQTELAHKIAPKSIFYKEWLLNRKKYIIDFIHALKEHDFSKIGKLTEYDTLCLHAIIMTGTPEENLIVWKPETLKIIKLTEKLRERGLPVYYSIDTGPSVVLLTLSNFTEQVIEELKKVDKEFQILVGKIGGESKLLDSNSPEAKLLEGDIIKWSVNHE